MIPDNVTLIVKAPNQQIEDQNIQCQSSWTVRQLKGYLSEVYPSKPRTEEQKIIYSGQLLDDNAILKDVLRTYESQIGHTMHLVCSSNRRYQVPTPPNLNQPTTDGLRRRNIPESQTETPEAPPRPETRQNDQNHSVEMQNYLSTIGNNYRVPPYPANYAAGQYFPMPNDPAAMNQMMMMHQAYMQYMQQYGQYANMWQNGGTGVPGAPPMNVINGAPPQPAPPAREIAREPGEEGGRRDWLDHVYAASRLCILLSLVYLYSSPFRLLLVIMVIVAGYLYQVGFFVELGINQPNNDNNQQQPQRNEQNAQPADNVAPPPETAGNNIIDDNDNQQSLLAVTWTIFTSFFASLIPEMNQ